MSDDHRQAVTAAAKLARKISLPSWEGSVFAWDDGTEKKIIVCANSRWLSRHGGIPANYLGYRVETQDRLVGTAHKMRI